ncbi:ABC transporter substrate-binding protein [Streptomyces sp. NK08204]|uniref:ABC transporter substrate-binding protein n=1 Tax=Streptomyces sp. NK08204 TaxID=2873260 RepID=UPI001CED38C8|nr:ABC transporter substrate-binding protein [Streptomyces sp. NK08204]
MDRTRVRRCTAARPRLAKAAAAFAKAGYTKKNGKLVGRDGKQLSFTILEVSEWADAIQRDKVIAQELKAAGIDVQVKPIASAQIDAKRKSGDFDVVVGGAVYYDTPYNFFRDMLSAAMPGCGPTTGTTRASRRTTCSPRWPTRLTRRPSRSTPRSWRS